MNYVLFPVEYERMKKVLLIIVSLVCVSGLFGQREKFNTMIGRWDIVGEQDAGASLEIIDSATIVLTYMGEKRKISHYTIDFSRSPYWFDFSAEDSASTVQVKSLIQIVGAGIIKWQLFIDEERSPYFTAEKGETYYLKKSRPNTAIAASH
jgi:hypothetical protein